MQRPMSRAILNIRVAYFEHTSSHGLTFDVVSSFGTAQVQEQHSNSGGGVYNYRINAILLVVVVHWLAQNIEGQCGCGMSRRRSLRCTITPTRPPRVLLLLLLLLLLLSPPLPPVRCSFLGCRSSRQSCKCLCRWSYGTQYQRNNY
jgi:hypothetical protein